MVSSEVIIKTTSAAAADSIQCQDHNRAALAHNQFLRHRFVAFWQHAHKPRSAYPAAIAITSEATRK